MKDHSPARKVAVIGSGEMGHGIAELFAIGGFDVSLVDNDKAALSHALVRVRESLDKLSGRGKLGQATPEAVMARIHPSDEIIDAVRDAYIVIEAVPEILELKRKIFETIDGSAPADAILGSNTSNIRIEEISSGVKRRDRVMGIHFFNPPVIMKLVEVVLGPETDVSLAERIMDILRSLGKVPVLVRKDSPGFIVNRINAADLLFFGLLLDKGMATPAEVDAFARSQGLPMGPYELMDFVGIDVVKNSLDYYAHEISEEYALCHVYADMVASNRLGKKTGRGFYEWKSGKADIDLSRQTTAVLLLDLFSIEINEAVKLIEEGVAGPDEIDQAVMLGMNRPFGPISVAKSMSSSEIRETLLRLQKTFGIRVFAPAPSIAAGRLREAVQGKKNRYEEEISSDAASSTQHTVSGPLLLEDVGEGVRKIVLNRPKLNTISPDLLDELERMIDMLWADREVRSIVITGNGENFSAGADLGTFFSSGFDFLEFSRKGERIFRKLSEIPKVTVAALKGYVLGGGLELALACDLRIASENTILGFPEVSLGLVPAWGGTQRLPRIAGLSGAMHLILSSERIGAREAMELGIVSRICTDVDGTGISLARTIASGSAPVAAALAKRLINKGAEVPSDVGLEMESFAAGLLFGTEDLKEGIGAFMQKRKPSFRGR